MKRWQKLAGTVIGLTIAGTAPIVPYDEKAVVWWEPYPGSEICHQKYADGTVTDFPCAEYWYVANTRGGIQPERRQYKSIVSTLTPKVEGAISVISNSSGEAATASSLTFAHTVAAGTDRILVVSSMNSHNDGGVGVQVVNSITYDTINLTKVQHSTRTGGGNEPRVEIWRLIDTDDSGSFDGTSNNIVITQAGTVDYLAAAAFDATGVDQTTPGDATAQAANGDATGPDTITDTITTVTDGALAVDSAGKSEDIPVLVVGAGQTSFGTQQDVTVGSFGASYESKATAGIVTMSWTTDADGQWATVLWALRPGAEIPATVTIPRLFLQSTAAHLQGTAYIVE